MRVEIFDKRMQRHAHVNEFRFLVGWRYDWAHSKYSHRVQKIILNLGGRLGSPYTLPLGKQESLRLAIKMLIREEADPEPVYISRVD